MTWEAVAQWSPTRRFLLPVPGPSTSKKICPCVWFCHNSLEKSVLGFRFTPNALTSPDSCLLLTGKEEAPRLVMVRGWELQVRLRIL